MFAHTRLPITVNHKIYQNSLEKDYVYDKSTHLIKGKTLLQMTYYFTKWHTHAYICKVDKTSWYDSMKRHPQTKHKS